MKVSASTVASNGTDTEIDACAVAYAGAGAAANVDQHADSCADYSSSIWETDGPIPQTPRRPWQIFEEHLEDHRKSPLKT